MRNLGMVTCVEGVHMAASLIECWPFNAVFRNCKDSSVVEPPLSTVWQHRMAWYIVLACSSSITDVKTFAALTENAVLGAVKFFLIRSISSTAHWYVVVSISASIRYRCVKHRFTSLGWAPVWREVVMNCCSTLWARWVFDSASECPEPVMACRFSRCSFTWLISKVGFPEWKEKEAVQFSKLVAYIYQQADKPRWVSLLT